MNVATDKGVLAVMDRAIENLQGAGVIGNTIGMKQARATVAELIEASYRLQTIRENGASHQEYEDAVRAHNAALARCNGEGA